MKKMRLDIWFQCRVPVSCTRGPSDVGIGGEGNPAEGGRTHELVTDGRNPVSASRRLSWILPTLIVVLSVCGAVEHERVRQCLLLVRAWSVSLGTPGLFVFAAVYVVAVVLFVPGTLLTSIATASFGPLRAIILVSVAGTLGASVCFLIARHGVRGPLLKRYSRNPRFVWLESAIQRRGALFVTVARVLPILPGNVLHYAFGLTCVPFGVFVFWSWLASLPGLVFFVLGLSAIIHLATTRSVPVSNMLALAGIVTVQVLLVRWAARVAREEGPPPHDGDSGCSGAPMSGVSSSPAGS